MESFKTRYGCLNGISSIDFYDSKNIKSCTLNEENLLQTSYGNLIPQYECSSERRKYIDSINFYSNGNLKSLYLQQQAQIAAPIGPLPAELVTFYESGNIKRIFPLNGKLTAYWSEDDEYNLAEPLKINTPIGEIYKKIISLYFYEDGNIKSITFWPKDSISFNSPIGNIEARTGISFYDDGSVKSFEPYRPTKTETPIGTILAYNNTAHGLHGDSNSVTFSKKGILESLITTTDKIDLIDEFKVKKTYRPHLKPSIINDAGFDIVPLSIKFDEDSVQFNDEPIKYEFKKYSFSIHPNFIKLETDCSNCSECSGSCSRG